MRMEHQCHYTQERFLTSTFQCHMFFPFAVAGFETLGEGQPCLPINTVERRPFRCADIAEIHEAESVREAASFLWW